MFSKNKFVCKCIPFSLDNVVFIWKVHTTSAGSDVWPGCSPEPKWPLCTSADLCWPSVSSCPQEGHLYGNLEDHLACSDLLLVEDTNLGLVGEHFPLALSSLSLCVQPCILILFQTWCSHSVWRVAPGGVSTHPYRKQHGGGSGPWRMRTMKSLHCLRWPGVAGSQISGPY